MEWRSGSNLLMVAVGNKVCIVFKSIFKHIFSSTLTVEIFFCVALKNMEPDLHHCLKINL